MHSLDYHDEAPDWLRELGREYNLAEHEYSYYAKSTPESIRQILESERAATQESRLKEISK